MNFAELYEQDLYSAKRCAIYFADRCKLLEQRMQQLEYLCHDMYKELKLLVDLGATISGIDTTTYRMEQLGLLEGGQWKIDYSLN